MPIVGSSMMKTRGLVSSHLANSTFCWLPPESWRAWAKGPGARTFSRAMLRTPVSTIFGRSSTPSRLAKRDEHRQADVVDQRELRKDALLEAIAGEERDAGGERRRGIAGRDRHAVDDHPSRHAAAAGRAEHGPGQFAETRPGKPGHAEHFAGASEKLTAFSRPGTVRFSTVISGALPSPAADLPRRVRLDVAPDHGVDHLRQRHVGDRSVGNHLAVAHHGEVVADLEDLVEIVRDEDDADAALRRASG